MVMTRTRYQAGIDEPSSSTASGILQAAIEEFDECGFAEASVGQIANRAGTSKSLVTYYFPTKSSLQLAFSLWLTQTEYSWAGNVRPVTRSMRFFKQPST